MMNHEIGHTLWLLHSPHPNSTMPCPVFVQFISSTPNFYSILGISKAASIADIGRAYKTLISKWSPDKNSSNKGESEVKLKTLDEAYRVLSGKRKDEDVWADVPKTPIPKKTSSSREKDEMVISSPVLLSRIGSRGDFLGGSSLSRCHSGNVGSVASNPTTPTGLSTSGTPIIYSQSTARRKLPPVERSLECTLEELLHGCVKSVSISRDIVTDVGLILQEEETIRIRVKSGWKKGTKITFEGKGDERPGTLPADLVFVIEEKRHPMFHRIGDHDLELAVEIPLVQSLTGCSNIDVPLLDGNTTSVSLDDDEIVYPGYVKVIRRQGMPKLWSEGRGDLHLKFLVQFPDKLSDQQRLDVVSILRDCFY